MSRTIGSNGPKTTEAIYAAGLALIYRHGYAAMSLRQLATEVGLQPGSLYNHISTKQNLLFSLLQTHMETLLAALDEALAPTEAPEAQLRAFAAFHVNYHITRRQEVFICYSELRSLDPANYDTIVTLRAQYERRLMRILARGHTAGAFTIHDTPATTYAILAMLTGVCTWYNPAGRLSAEALTAIYTAMTLNAVGARLPTS
jgi:AcrR family transcriptional regulator